MRDSGIFGSPRRNIIIGAVLLMTGLVATVISFFVAMLLFLAGMAIAGIGIAKYGTQQYWWGDMYGRSEPDVSSDEQELGAPNEGREPGGSTISVNLSEGDTRAMKIAAMVLGILGLIVTFFISIFAVALGGLASMVTGEGSYVFIGWLVVLSSILALVGAMRSVDTVKRKSSIDPGARGCDTGERQSQARRDPAGHSGGSQHAVHLFGSRHGLRTWDPAPDDSYGACVHSEQTGER